MKKILTLIMIALLVCSCGFVSHAATMTKITPDEPTPTVVEYKLEIKDNEPAEEKQDLLSFSVNKGGETDIPFHLFLYENKLWFGNEELKSYALDKYDCLQCNSKPVSSGTWIVKFYDGGIDVMPDGVPQKSQQVIKCAGTSYQLDIAQFLSGQGLPVSVDETPADEKSASEAPAGINDDSFMQPGSDSDWTTPVTIAQQNGEKKDEKKNDAKQKDDKEMSSLEIGLILFIVIENTILIVFLILRKKKTDRTPAQPTKRDDGNKQKSSSKQVATLPYTSASDFGTPPATTKPTKVNPSAARSGQAGAREPLPDPFNISAPTFNIEQLTVREDQPPIEDSYVSAAGAAKRSAPDTDGIRKQIAAFYAGTASPDASSLRIEPLEITNFQQMRFSSDELPVFKVTRDMDAASFVLVEGAYVCLNFYRFSGQQFKAYGDIQGLRNCFDIFYDGAQARPQNQPIASLAPGKAVLNGTNYQLTEKGRLDLGV